MCPHSSIPHSYSQAIASSDSITHLTFVSESCLPAVSLENALTLIRNDNTSWINWKPEANNGYATQEQFLPLSRSIPMECIFKADQWVLLLRTHAEKMLAMIDSLPFDPFKPFQNVRSDPFPFRPHFISPQGSCE